MPSIRRLLLATLRPVAWLPLVAAALAVAVTLRASADQGAPALALRSPLPRIEGESLSAKRVVLPDDVKGKIGLLVFSFSRGAGDAARCWRETFARIGMPDADAASFGILMLADVPWVMRGLATYGIKSGMPAALHDRTVKLFADDDLWRARLGVKAADAAHLVLVDRAGRVRWLYAEACDSAGDQRLREQVKVIVAEKVTPR